MGLHLFFWRIYGLLELIVGGDWLAVELKGERKKMKKKK